MIDLSAQVAKTVGSHFVTLSCVQCSPSGERIKSLVFSGFVIEVSGEWFYVTAGHILTSIRKVVEHGGSFDTWRLGDQTAGGAFGDKVIPYDFQLDNWLVLHDDEKGFDYATVLITPFFRRGLEAGGVKAIDEGVWSDHIAEADHWIIAGTPSESVRFDGVNTIRARFIVDVLKPADAPAGVGSKAAGRFYAEFRDAPTPRLSDPDGLSGGPVFALKFVDNEWRYAIIGVQCAVDDASKKLSICPFISFALALKSVVVQALGSADTSVGRLNEDGPTL